MEATPVFTTIPGILFMHLLMTDVKFEPVRILRRRLAMRYTSSLPSALQTLPFHSICPKVVRHALKSSAQFYLKCQDYV